MVLLLLLLLLLPLLLFFFLLMMMLLLLLLLLLSAICSTIFRASLQELDGTHFTARYPEITPQKKSANFF